MLCFYKKLLVSKDNLNKTSERFKAAQRTCNFWEIAAITSTALFVGTIFFVSVFDRSFFSEFSDAISLSLLMFFVFAVLSSPLAGFLLLLLHKIYNRELYGWSFGKPIDDIYYCAYEEGHKDAGGFANDPILDCVKDGARFILLVGRSASGKTVFSKYLHEKLLGLNMASRLLVMDMKRVFFLEYNKDFHTRLLKPVITDMQNGVYELEQVAENYKPSDAPLVIHIDECEMVMFARERVDKAIKKIKQKKNITIIYVTSLIDADYLKDWIRDFVDVTVAFRVSRESDSRFLVGDNSAYHLTEPGSHIVVFKNEEVVCPPIDLEPESAYLK